MLFKRRGAVLLVLAAVALLSTACLPVSILLAPVRAVREVLTEPTATPAPAPASSQPVVIQVPVQHPESNLSTEQAEQPSLGERGTLVDLYQRLVPGVVSVQVIQRGPDDQLSGGAGSGFFYDYQGHIVTNAHVVRDAYMVDVVLYDETIVPAEVIGTDDDSDLAVLLVDLSAIDLPNDAVTPLPLADSDAVLPGLEVIAIGNPFGRQSSMTYGIISAVGRTIGSLTPFSIPQAIQTDAAINPGNSGGPLLDLSGRVIGVNSQIISPSRASAGIGFAVSSNTVRRVVPELIARGYYPHPWLGTYMLSLTAASSEAFREAGMDLPVDAGLYVLEVVAGGPADRAGMRGGSRLVRFGQVQVPLDGDVIVAVDGQPVENFQDLTVYLEGKTIVGQAVAVTVLRDGREQTLQATLQERPQ